MMKWHMPAIGTYGIFILQATVFHAIITLLTLASSVKSGKCRPSVPGPKTAVWETGLHCNVRE